MFRKDPLELITELIPSIKKIEEKVDEPLTVNEIFAIVSAVRDMPEILVSEDDFISTTLAGIKLTRSLKGVIGGIS